jgi:hypothetical protein
LEYDGPLVLRRLDLLALMMMSDFKDIREATALLRGTATRCSVYALWRLARTPYLTSTDQQRASAQPEK